MFDAVGRPDRHMDMTKLIVFFFRTCLETSPLIMYTEIVAVCSQIHTKHINTMCGQNVKLLNVKVVVHIVTTAVAWVTARCSHTEFAVGCGYPREVLKYHNLIICHCLQSSW